MSLGDRIKRYEAASSYRLLPRSCLFLRVDGRAFHTFTRGCARPFDAGIIDAMRYATEETAKEMQGFKLAYTQSDEATFLLTDFDDYETQGWFGYELAKVVSVSASTFTAYFNHRWQWWAPSNKKELVATFDSRAFTVPVEDAPNVFIWRQQDWERNSIQMYAQSIFSNRELQGKSHPEIHEMLHERGLNWADLEERHKNGTFILRNGQEWVEKCGYEDVKSLIWPEADDSQEAA